CGESHDRLEQGIKKDGPRVAIGDRSDEQAAEAEAADEDGQHGGRGGGGGAKNQPKLAQPRDLVHKRAAPRSKQQRADLPRPTSHSASSRPSPPHHIGANGGNRQALTSFDISACVMVSSKSSPTLRPTPP